MAPSTGTRYARGAQRRSALIRAAADLLLEQGLGALSHRAVASRAGLPLASTTYYFASADDLRDEALQHVAQRWAARAREVVAALPDRLDARGAAHAVARVIAADATGTDEMLLMYERYLESGRHERLRPVVVLWNDRLEDLVGQVLIRAGLAADDGRARLVLAVADGVAVTALAEGTPVHGAVRASVHQVLELLQAAAGDRPHPPSSGSRPPASASGRAAGH